MPQPFTQPAVESSLNAGPLVSTRRDALRQLGALSIAPVLSSAWIQHMLAVVGRRDAQGPIAAGTQQPVPTGELVTATLDIGSASAGRGGIARGFLGLSYEKSILSSGFFTGRNAPLIALFKALGQGVLRIGGNSVEETDWSPQGPGRTQGKVSPADVQELNNFLKATGWQCLYGINLAGDRSGRQTPELAVSEVAYVHQLGALLLGIEIGNEVDMYGLQVKTPDGRIATTGPYFESGVPWTAERFMPLWNKYRAAILKAVPEAVITGPTSADHEATFTASFAQLSKSKISLLTQHYYRDNGLYPTSTAIRLISPDSKLTHDLELVAASAASIGVPFRLTECNSYYMGGAPGVSNGFCSSLWVLDFLFTAARYGSRGVNMHGGGNAAYSPLVNNGDGHVTAVRPEYYGLLLFSMAGTGPLVPAALGGVGQLNVTAYALKRPSGGHSIVIVNKDETAPLRMEITLPVDANRCQLFELTQSSGPGGPKLAATSGVRLQGVTVGADGSLLPGQPQPYALAPKGKKLSCFVPALSAVLLQVV